MSDRFLGVSERIAHVQPVSVQDTASEFVAISTLPEAVVLAFGVEVPVARLPHAPLW